MAICPECFSEKPWMAPRCHACNEDIGFIRQSFAMIVYSVVSVAAFVFFIWLIIKIMNMA